MLTGLLFLSLALVAASEGKHWALVVAGSSGWDNYRHQVQYTVSLCCLVRAERRPPFIKHNLCLLEFV